jgi:hypothetical protein
MNQLVNKLVDRMVDKLVDERVDGWVDQATHHSDTDLDQTTLGKVHPDKGALSTTAGRQLSTGGLKVPRTPVFAQPGRIPSIVPRAQLQNRLSTAPKTECGNQIDMLFGGTGPSVVFLTMGGGLDGLGPASSEAKEKSLARKYSLVGNWDNWASFTDFAHKEESADGTAFVAEVPVPASNNIEFQIVGDGDWKNRFFPAGDGKTIFGPTPEGHGENWRHGAPAQSGQKMRVKFYPTAGEKGDGRKLESSLV